MFNVYSPLGNISKLEKVGSSTKQKTDSVYGLEMYCKVSFIIIFFLKTLI